MNNSIEFYLSKPISVAKGGEQVEVSLLELNAPSSKVRTQAAKLKQLVMRAVNDVSEGISDEMRKSVTEKQMEEVEQSSPEEAAEGLMGVVNVSKSVDMAVLHEVFADLITREGICMIDGDVKMTSPLYDKIDFKDNERLLGFYVQSFLL
jgi:ribosome biogenesis protein Tsr3